MKIRNKNGRRLFMTDNVNTGWDGTFKDDTCTAGLYYFEVGYESLEGEKRLDEGVLELVK